MFKKIINNEKGSAYIEFLISFLCIITVVSIGVSVFKIHPAKNDLDNIASTLIEVAETTGTTDMDLTINSIKSSTGKDFTVDWTGTEYIVGERNVQLGDTIMLELTSTHTIGVGKWKQSITIHSRRTGMSEKYFKI